MVDEETAPTNDGVPSSPCIDGLTWLRSVCDSTRESHLVALEARDAPEVVLAAADETVRKLSAVLRQRGEEIRARVAFLDRLMASQISSLRLLAYIG